MSTRCCRSIGVEVDFRAAHDMSGARGRSSSARPEVPAVGFGLLYRCGGALRDLKHAGAGRVQVPPSRVVSSQLSAAAEATRDAS